MGGSGFLRLVGRSGVGWLLNRPTAELGIASCDVGGTLHAVIPSRVANRRTVSKALLDGCGDALTFGGESCVQRHHRLSGVLDADGISRAVFLVASPHGGLLAWLELALPSDPFVADAAHAAPTGWCVNDDDARHVTASMRNDTQRLTMRPRLDDDSRLIG
jgi:hypothetical protein